ncbi:MAG: hypothetical protein P8K08_10955 [Fuerstiella sp.]|jgi:hypothetical protein|nr:hypothetical protein [Fuerstiella sp.]
MYRPHFSIKGGHRPIPLNDLQSFEEAVTSSAQNDVPATRPSGAMPSIDDLRRMMHNEPEVRQVLMNEIRQKLIRGEYLSRKAATESAGRILDSDNLFQSM